MTTPTPAAQKAINEIAHIILGEGLELAESEKRSFAAIIDREMNQWQDISTAPKDGTEIFTMPHYRITHWRNELSDESSGWSGEYNEACDAFDKIRPSPTHWIPLPPPPCTAKP